MFAIGVAGGVVAAAGGGGEGFTVDREGEEASAEWKFSKSLKEFARIKGGAGPWALNQFWKEFSAHLLQLGVGKEGIWSMKSCSVIGGLAKQAGLKYLHDGMQETADGPLGLRAYFLPLGQKVAY